MFNLCAATTPLRESGERRTLMEKAHSDRDVVAPFV